MRCLYSVLFYGNFQGKADQKQKMGIAFFDFPSSFVFSFNLIHLLVVWGYGHPVTTIYLAMDSI